MKKIWIATALTLLVLAAYMGRKLTSDYESIEAFINAEVVDYKANTIGEWIPAPKLADDAEFRAGESFGIVRRPDSDPGILNIRTTMLNIADRINNAASRIRNIEERIRTNDSYIRTYKAKYEESRKIMTNIARLQTRYLETITEKRRIMAKNLESNYRRSENLFAKRIISNSALEDNQADYLSRLQELKALEIQRKINEENKTAVRRGLQSENNQVFNYYLARVNEYQETNARLRNEISLLKKNIEQARALYESYERLYGDVTALRFIAGGNERIWQIRSHGQKVTEAGELLFSTLKCDNIWVEAFVYQKEAAAFAVGRRVRVEIRGVDGSFKGVVTALRHNVSRVEIGNAIPSPPVDLIRRQLPVKIASVIVKMEEDKAGALHDQPFCGAGMTATIYAKSHWF